MFAVIDFDVIANNLLGNQELFANYITTRKNITLNNYSFESCHTESSVGCTLL